MPATLAQVHAGSDPNLIPMTRAVQTLAPHGVEVSYSQLWNLTVSGKVPSIRRANRVYLVGQPADLAKLILHYREGIKKRRNAA